MDFPGYLSAEQIDDLLQKAVASDLVSAERAIYLNQIFRAYALALPKVSSSLDQFNLDLIQLNRTERLIDGQIPLAQFLRNCARWLRLRGRPEANDFELIANAIGNRAAGVSRLPEPVSLPEIQRNEAIIGIDDMVDFAFLQAGLQAGRSVARIVIPRFQNGAAVKTDSNAPWRMVGTAWMIGKDLVLTNHHVVNARKSDEPVASEADFDRQGKEALLEFDFDQSGSTPIPVKALGVVASSLSLDYALLRLEQAPQRPALKLSGQLVTYSATTYLPVNIIQHPRGLPKRVAFRNNLVTAADDETIRYFTDTDYGSSGSPVCMDNWQVVALHRGAKFVNDVKFQGKSTAYVNFGSQIQAILTDLQTRFASLRSEIP